MKIPCASALTITLILFTVAGCSTWNAPPMLTLLGDAASNTAAERSIVIGPETRHINVTGGEIVRFDVGIKSFTWHFDGAINVTRFSLQQVAPAGMLDHDVIAYVRPNPFFIGSDHD